MQQKIFEKKGNLIPPVIDENLGIRIIVRNISVQGAVKFIPNLQLSFPLMVKVLRPSIKVFGVFGQISVARNNLLPLGKLKFMIQVKLESAVIRPVFIKGSVYQIILIDHIIDDSRSRGIPTAAQSIPRCEMTPTKKLQGPHKCGFRRGLIEVPQQDQVVMAQALNFPEKVFAVGKKR